MNHGARFAIATHGTAIAVTCAAVLLAGGTPEGQRVDSGSDPIAFMTVNVRFFLSPEPGLASSLESLAALLKRNAIDIVALQESDANTVLGANQNGPWWLARELGYYYYYGAPSSHHTTGVALLSRWPIRDPQWTLLPAEASIPRGALTAEVDVPSGSIRVVVGHLQWAEEYLPGEPTAAYLEDQSAQAQLLLDLASVDGPVVVLGDFNAGPGYPGPAYELFKGSFLDAWVAAGNPPDDPGGFTWPVQDPTMRIDFVWFSPADWRVVQGSARTVGDESVTDHKAVYAQAFLRPRPR